MYLASDEESPRFNRRKNTRKWCKGKRGVKHTPILSKESYKCYWYAYYAWDSKEENATYQCNHKKSCSVCGIVLEWSIVDKTECPHYRDTHWTDVDRFTIEDIEGDHRVTYFE